MNYTEIGIDTLDYDIDLNTGIPKFCQNLISLSGLYIH